MYVQTKKVVIIYIVTLVSLISIISTLYKETQDTVTQISVVSSEELSYKVSFAQNIFNELSIDGQGDKDIVRYGASLYQISDSSNSQFANIVNSSEVTIVIGDTFNEFMEDMIVENPEKQFVLIENSLDYDEGNVLQINVDYNQVYETINRVSNENEGSLVILTDEFSVLAENEYYAHEVTANPNVKLEIVSDTTDNVTLEQTITKDLDDGFTNVYNLDPYNNATVIETVQKFNAKIVEDDKSEKRLEESEELSSAVESEVTSSVTEEVESEQQVKLKYLTLNQTEYLGERSNENISSYSYDIEEEVADIISRALNEELKHGNVEISITSNK